MADRLYCTLAELMDDLGLEGLKPREEKRAMDRIQAASDYIDEKFGQFIPVLRTRRYDGPGGRTLFVELLLSLTSIVDDTVTLVSTDYLLYPREKHWDNGPYTRIEIDPDSASLGAWTAKKDDIVIVGLWGKYLKSLTTETTVANATQISSSGTALQVANGSKVSPGMILLIESEQLLVRATGARSAATSLLNEALDATELEVDVDSSAEFNAGEVIRVETEDMLIEDIGGNTLVVLRGWNGTTPAAHANDTAISVYRTYTVERGVNGTTAAAHANGMAISRYVPPGDVNWLARQIAGLMQNKAKGGFAGKSGSAELGTIFYHDEFPKRQVEEVKSNYRIARV